MPKTEQRKLLLLTGTTEIGWSFIGIFFVFFIQKNFGLTVWQTMAWFGLLQIISALIIYPINAWSLAQLGLKKMLTLGVFLELGFVMILALGWSNWWGFFWLNLFFSLYLCFFWPTYNYLNTVATNTLGRGTFLANIQAIYIGAGLLTPILTGWLFDLGQQHWALWGALGFYAVSLWLTQKLVIPDLIDPLTWRQSTRHFQQIFFREGRFWGFIPDVIMGAAMWIIWPFYFQFVVGKFVVMGLLTSLAAFIEIFTARIVGKLSDQYSAKKILRFAAWARVIDLLSRSSFLVFSGPWFVATVQSLGAILGPIFLIPYSQRVMEIGEEQTTSAKLFDYFLLREIFLGLGRGMFMLLSSLLVYIFGLWVGGIIIALAGLTALGTRKL